MVITKKYSIYVTSDDKTENAGPHYSFIQSRSFGWEGNFHNEQGKANRVMKMNLNFLTFQIFVLPKILNFY